MQLFPASAMGLHQKRDAFDREGNVGDDGGEVPAGHGCDGQWWTAFVKKWAKSVKKPGPAVHDDLCTMTDENGWTRNSPLARTSCGWPISLSTRPLRFPLSSHGSAVGLVVPSVIPKSFVMTLSVSPVGETPNVTVFKGPVSRTSRATPRRVFCGTVNGSVVEIRMSARITPGHRGRPRGSTLLRCHRGAAWLP